MGNLPFDGNYRLFVVDSIADITAPTVAEIAAGTEITTFVPKNGWSVTNTSNRVDSGNIATQYDAEVLGTWKMQIDLTVLLDDTSDTAWDEFQTHAAATHLVVLPYKGSGTPAAGDKAQVYPVETGQATPAASAANERQTATVPCAVTAEPSLDGAVAA